MKNSTDAIHCPSCGGSVKFDTQKLLLVCDYCAGEFSPEEMDSANDNFSAGYQSGSYLEDQPGYICEACGAQVIAGLNAITSTCAFCSNAVIIINSIQGQLRPDMIVPFKVTHEGAIAQMKQFFKRKLMLPSSFKKEHKITDITGMYLPFWVFSGVCNAKFAYIGNKSVKNHNAGGYTKTAFDVERHSTLKFSDIPINASTKMSDEYMDGLGIFDLSVGHEFSSRYLAGIYAEKFDMEADVCEKRAQDQIRNTITEATISKVNSKYATVRQKDSWMRLSQQNVKYCLMPVWILNTRYKGKLYKFAINAQTGRVSCELPISKVKLWFWRTICMLPFFTLLVWGVASGNFNEDTLEYFAVVLFFLFGPGMLIPMIIKNSHTTARKSKKVQKESQKGEICITYESDIAISPQQ